MLGVLLEELLVLFIFKVFLWLRLTDSGGSLRFLRKAKNFSFQNRNGNDKIGSRLIQVFFNKIWCKKLWEQLSICRNWNFTIVNAPTKDPAGFGVILVLVVALKKFTLIFVGSIFYTFVLSFKFLFRSLPLILLKFSVILQISRLYWGG